MFKRLLNKPVRGWALAGVLLAIYGGPAIIILSEVASHTHKKIKDHVEIYMRK